MGSERRLIRVPSETYVYAKVNPEDADSSAASIMLKLAGFRSFTYLRPFEEVALVDAPAEVLQHFQNETQATDSGQEEAAEGEAPVVLQFQEGVEPREGEWLCRLHSATYVMVVALAGDVSGTWRAVKQQLGTRSAFSLATADVDVLPYKAAPEDVRLWVLYGASDRVVMPLWPAEEIDNPEKATAWKSGPAMAEERQPYSGPYIRVVAVHPQHVRGMLCRMWHARRDEKAGLGTVYGKYPVDVAVSVPSEKRTPHIHSFDWISPRDWRPGLVFYGVKDEDGCPLDYVGERLEQYCVANNWVDEPTWRRWLE
ncbi:MAG: hypothetical protein ACUVWR_14485 [Anaerolineae bacterium]